MVSLLVLLNKRLFRQHAALDVRCIMHCGYSHGLVSRNETKRRLSSSHLSAWEEHPLCSRRRLNFRESLAARALALPLSNAYALAGRFPALACNDQW